MLASFCLEQGADLHMAQLMPLPLTVSCFSKIQIGFTFLVPAYPGSPRKRAVKWVNVLLWMSKLINYDTVVVRKTLNFLIPVKVRDTVSLYVAVSHYMAL